MTGLPTTIELKLDDGTGTFPYDITSRLRLKDGGYTVTRGRQDEISEVTAGQLAATLKNNDGGMTLGSTVLASPSPVKLDQKVRLRTTVNGVTRTRFIGYLDQLPVEWPGGKQLSLAKIGATDAQARAERWPLRSIVEQEIGADLPWAYYNLGEAEGSTAAADSSGNQAPSLAITGTGAGVVFGAATGSAVDGHPPCQRRTVNRQRRRSESPVMKGSASSCPCKDDSLIISL